MPSPSLGIRGAALAVALAAPACSAPEAAPCLEPVTQAVYEGAADLPDVAPGLASNVGAFIVDSPDGKPHAKLCTAIRIAPGRALTAGHCVRALAADRAQLQFGVASVRASSCARRRGVTRYEAHPSLDLALLFFEDFSAAEPPTLASSLPTLASEVALAGYGLTEDGTVGALRWSRANVIRVTASVIEVDAAGRAGACVGDSGGPLWIDVPGAGITLLGVLARGSPTCTETDEYVPASAVRPWLDRLALGVSWTSEGE